MTGFVYAIGDETGRVKIGWSNDPCRRLSKIKTDCLTPVRLLGLVPAIKKQEAEVHRLLKPWRANREWYCLKDRPVAAFVEMLSKPQPRPVTVDAHPIASYRIKHRITQAELAALLGVDRVTVARWEVGLRKIDQDRILDISAKTGIPVGELRPDLANLLRQEPAS